MASNSQQKSHDGKSPISVCATQAPHSEALLHNVLTIMNASFDAQYGEAWNYEQLRSMLALPSTILWLAVLTDDNPVGFSVVRTIAGEAEIMLIAVAPEFQRRDVGRDMLQTIIEASQRNHVAQIFLEVRKNNSALDFYEKHSFTKIGLRKDYYKGCENNRYDAITLSRNLV